MILRLTYSLIMHRLKRLRLKHVLLVLSGRTHTRSTKILGGSRHIEATTTGMAPDTDFRLSPTPVLLPLIGRTLVIRGICLMLEELLSIFNSDSLGSVLRIFHFYSVSEYSSHTAT